MIVNIDKMVFFDYEFMMLVKEYMYILYKLFIFYLIVYYINR